jgi:DNA repair exonuclease SbcCD ATPase subunit
VTRTRKHRSLKNGLWLFQDGKDISGASMDETQQRICQLLGMTAQTFQNTVIFGQTAAYRFSALPDSAQKAIFDEALGTEAFAKACQVARSELSELKAKLAAEETEEAKLVDRLAHLEISINGWTRENAEFNEKQETRIAELVKRQWEKRKEIDAAAEGEIEVDARKKAVETLKRVRESAEGQASATQKDWNTTQATLATVNRHVQELEDELEASQKAKEPTCDACGQVVTPEHRNAHARAVSERLEHARTEHQAQQDAERRSWEAHCKAQETAKKAAEALRAGEQALLRAERASGELHLFERDLARLEAEERRIRTEENVYATLITRERREEGIAQDVLKCVHARLSTLRERRGRLEFWVEGFGAKGLRALLIDNALPLLNTHAERYAKTLSDNTLDVSFHTQSNLKSGKVAEKFEVRVENQHGAGSYAGHSAGEKAKIDLIVGLALQALVAARSKAKINVAFFDEPFEHMDEVAIERVLELLTTALGDRESVFVITHVDALKSHFPNLIKVVKERGQSRVEA